MSDIAIFMSVRQTLRGLLGPSSQRLCVIVADGVVTLNGCVDSLDERITAACAVRRLPGVRALADGIDVTSHASGRP